MSHHEWRPEPYATCPRCEGIGKVFDGQQLGFQMSTLRRDANLTIYDMAELLGLNFTYISKLENDRFNWPVKVVRQYLLALEKALPLNEASATTLGRSETELFGEVKE